QNVSRADADLPGTLSQTTSTLAKVQAFANALGPAATNLLPAARAIPAANAALTTLAGPNPTTCGSASTCSIVRNQIRPFVIAARPPVRNLRPAAVHLATATPSVSSVFTRLNHLLNMVGHNPSGKGQHGYLWWLAWLQHNTRTLFSLQNGDGDFRPLLLEADCKEIKKIGATNGGVAGGILFPVINAKFCLP